MSFVGFFHLQNGDKRENTKINVAPNHCTVIDQLSVAKGLSLKCSYGLQSPGAMLPMWGMYGLPTGKLLERLSQTSITIEAEQRGDQLPDKHRDSFRVLSWHSHSLCTLSGGSGTFQGSLIFPYFSSLSPSTIPEGITPETILMGILMGTALTQGTIPWLHILKACLYFCKAVQGLMMKTLTAFAVSRKSSDEYLHL